MSYAGDLTPTEAWAFRLENPDAVLVDVRTVAEWETVGIPDLSSLERLVVFDEWVQAPSGTPNPTFLAELEEAGLAAGGGRPVVFLCRAGQRSIGAATAATAAGLGPAYNVLAGFEGVPDASGRRSGGWKSEGLPWGTR